MDLTVNLTLLPMMGLFLVTVLVLNSFVFKTCLKIIKKRNEATTGLISEAQKLNTACLAQLENYQKKLAQARHVAHIKRDEILKQITPEIELVLQKAKADSEEVLARAVVGVENETRQVRQVLASKSTELSHLICEKLVGRQVV